MSLPADRNKISGDDNDDSNDNDKGNDNANCNDNVNENTKIQNERLKNLSSTSPHCAILKRPHQK